jgi:paraquat-inducible protein A
MSAGTLTLCDECDLLQRSPPLPPGGTAHCVRCGHTLHRDRPDSVDRTLALTVTGAVLFIIANSFPFLSFEMQGQLTQTTLMTGVRELVDQGKGEVALVVFFTSVLAPALQLLLLLLVLLPLKLRDRLPPGFPTLFRWFKSLAPWGMMDVFMIGILVSVVKLADMASIVPGTALFAFVVLIFVLAAAQAALDPDVVWSRVPLPAALSAAPRAGEPVVGCDVCELVVAERTAAVDKRGRLRCPRCTDVLHRRKPESLQRTWAFLIAAALCYLPANLYPIMSVTSLGQTQSDTILSGVLFLLHHGMWPLAAIVFVASIFVPLLKLLILLFLLLSVQRKSSWRPRDRTRLYRITEAIGRWSMVDVYVVTILVALVHLGNLASIEAEAGAVFFCAVVIITMFAAMSFDPRLIWDACARSETAAESVPAAAAQPAGAGGDGV